MTDSSTKTAKAPDPVLDADLLSELGGNISGRTTPSSFRESPIGWGMMLLCGSTGGTTIDTRESLVAYYNESTFTEQQNILSVLNNQDKEARLGLFAKSLFYACSKNFMLSHSRHQGTQNALVIYDSIESFNETNVLKDETKKYKLSSVQEQLAGRNSQMLVDMILNVCGAFGMPYEAMQALLNKPEVVYSSFQSTFGEAVSNHRGTTRGYALWVLYAAAKQCFSHATSYVVDDMFYIDVHSNNGQDEDIDTVLNELGVFAEMNPGLVGYDLRKVEGKYYFMPSPVFVKAKLDMLIVQANARYWENRPEELNAHLLQLGYVLNPTTEEFSAILGILRQTARFVPNINCTYGRTPATIQDLIAVHDHSRFGTASEIVKFTVNGSFKIKQAVTTFQTVMHRTYRHYSRHANEKLWFIEGNMLSADQKVQMKHKLYDEVLQIGEVDWGTTDDSGWAN